MCDMCRKFGNNEDKVLIYKLTGKIIEKQPAYIVIEVAGVAYVVNISLSTYSSSKPEGSEDSIFTHMAVREDDISLYGFSTLDEKKMFLLLISVNSIGAKLAIKILGGIGQKELKHAIASSDYELLSSIPGVGKKTAERIVVDLKDKVDSVQLGVSSDSGDSMQDVISALVNLGFKPQDCRKALDGVDSDASFDDAIKQALQKLTGKK